MTNWPSATAEAQSYARSSSGTLGRVPQHPLYSLHVGPGPLLGEDDLTSAIVLTRLVRSELEAFGTGGGERLSDRELELTQRTLRAVVYRMRDRPPTALAKGVR